MYLQAHDILGTIVNGLKELLGAQFKKTQNCEKTDEEILSILNERVIYEHWTGIKW